MKKATLVSVFVIALLFVVAGYFYYVIPGDVVMSHWNASGKVNGYLPKFIGLFLVPLITLGIYLLFFAIPKIDPLKGNIAKSRKYYDSFVIVFIIFMLYVFVFTIIANLGYNFNMTQVILPAIGFIFIYIGYIIRFLKRNWFIGIRTPWTISSDIVWKKTHEIGSVLFILSGVLVVLGIFFQRYLIWFILVPIIGSSVITIVYSYLVYKKIETRKK